MSTAPQSFAFVDSSSAAKTGQTLPIGPQSSTQSVSTAPASDTANLEPAAVAITGASMPAGGVGLTGWLSAIWAKLSGTLAVSAASLPLPTGAAQESGGNLAAILAKIVSGIGVTGTFWQATQPVSASSLPLPTGAATAANQASLITTTAGTAGRAVMSDPTTGVGALVQAFHNADNVTLSGTSYGLMTGGVDQIVNGSGNLDRKRGVAGDGMAITGLAAEVPMIFNGATYDRLRSVSGDAAAATGIVQEAVALWNGATYDRWYGSAALGAFVQVKALPPVVTSNPVGAGAFATAQASIGTSAALVSAARTGAQGVGRIAATIYNGGSVAIVVGASGVTLTTGITVPAGASLTLNTTAAIYAISGAAGQTVSVVETF